MNTLKRISIVTGHYGCGKTNFSVNLALYIKKHLQKDCILIDLDIVNPYFRSADMQQLLKKEGIEVIAPTFANTNLDIPVLPPSMEGALCDESHYVVVDVGGDDAGAIALGRYAGLLKEKNDFYMFYLINRYRYLQGEDDTVELLRQVETASRLKASFLVNNSNLAAGTTERHILESIPYAEQISRESGLETAFTCCPKELLPQLKEQIPLPFAITRFVRLPWEEQ